jgi:hypothetical protein
VQTKAVGDVIREIGAVNSRDNSAVKVCGFVASEKRND